MDTILQAAEMKKKEISRSWLLWGVCLKGILTNCQRDTRDRSYFGSNDHRQIVSFLTGKDFHKDDPLF